MVVISFMLMATCVLVSVMSRSAIKWSCLMAAGMATSSALGYTDRHTLIWAVDLFMLMAMIGMRQEINREWQDGVVRLQLVIAVAYTTLAVFAERASWLISPLIDMTNLLCLVQLALLGFGGLTNSQRNYRYIRDQRRAGNKIPWLLTAWRMT